MGFGFTGKIGGAGKEWGGEPEGALVLRRPDPGILFLGGRTGEDDSAPDWKMLLSSQPLSSPNYGKKRGN